jgi:hypothetical protein
MMKMFLLHLLFVDVERFNHLPSLFHMRKVSSFQDTTLLMDRTTQLRSYLPANSALKDFVMDCGRFSPPEADATDNGQTNDGGVSLVDDSLAGEREAATRCDVCNLLVQEVSMTLCALAACHADLGDVASQVSRRSMSITRVLSS